MLEPFSPSFYKRLQQLKIRTRRTFLGSRQGTHLSNRRGHGLEFADHRLYSPGDDFRHIDWSVYARTDRVYIRQFRDEQDLNVAFLLDTSSSMAHPEGEGKFDLARKLALALGYVALTDGDTVTLSFLGQKNTPRYVGPRSVHRILGALNETKAGGNYKMLDEIRSSVSRIRLPGKCFFISDFLFPIEEQIECIDYLRAKNFEIAVLHVLAPAELRLEFASGSSYVVDAETNELVELSLGSASRKEYAQLLATHVEELEQHCHKCGIPHVLVSSKEDVSEVVLTRLPEFGLLQ